MICTAMGFATLGQYANLGSVTGKYDTLVVTDEDSSHYIGIARPSVIGDFVWNDSNNNSIQDTSEVGIQGVTVILHKVGNTPIDTTTTDSSGMYFFTNLAQDSYYVQFVLPAGFMFCLKDQGSNDSLDSDPDSTGMTDVFFLAAGQNDSTRDAGLCPLASVSDFVWNDVNQNGIQDSTETGIDSVLVKIFSDKDKDDKSEPGGDDGAPLDSTYTDSTGFYIFTNLIPAKYFLMFTLPPGYVFSPDNQGGDDSVDSDPDTTSGVTGVFILNPGQNDQTVDAGGFPTSSIGDFVWLDANVNGIQDGSENGINNIKVELYRQGELTPLRDTLTANHPVTTLPGYYMFPDLIPDNYVLKFYLPFAWEFGPQNVGGDDTIDSDASQSNGRTGVFALASGVVDTTWDAGMYRPGAIGDYVWNDVDGEGDQDAGESGIPNVIIKLWYQGGVIALDTTDANGNYLFTRLLPGNYIVDVDETTIPAGYVLTTANEPHPVSLSNAQFYTLADFGYRFLIPTPEPGRKYILARYQSWYGDTENDSTLRHWDFNNLGGQADTSLFEFYDSYDEKIWEYHILLAWACGIDGFVFDWLGKDAFENMGIKGLLNKADQLYQKYNQFGFNFEIAVSYNEMAKDSLDTNFEYIGDSLMTHPAYWGTRRFFRRPLFLFNHDEEDTLITAQEYRACGDTTLPADYFLLWNGTEEEVFDFVDVCYPWIQPLDGDWDPLGLKWGEFYLDSTYWRENFLPDPGDLLFALGGVWPGKDDRKYSKSQNHFMDRQDTLVYEATWEKVHNYNYALPMPWCLIETWNDFNQATEIEPSIEHHYKFNVLTRDNARIFKGTLPPDSVGVENMGLLVPQHIQQARIAAQLRPFDAAQINTLIQQALDSFFVRKHLDAISLADRAAGIEPKPFTIDVIGDTCISLSWGTAKYANNYNIYYSTDSNRFEPCSFKQPDMISVGNVTKYTFEGCEPSTRYYIAVTASDTTLGPYANDSWYANVLTGATIKSIKTTNQILNPKTSIEDELIPKEFSLSQNYPNPFNPFTTIKYALPVSQHVVLKVYDIQGREVITLINEQKKAGFHDIILQSINMPSGTYFYRLKTEKYLKIRKLMVIK
jgi:hypothetical protein